ncbi:hypothetical protein F4680DRAFT_464450, partial [Xylaria scruposa]
MQDKDEFEKAITAAGDLLVEEFGVYWASIIALKRINAIQRRIKVNDDFTYEKVGVGWFLYSVVYDVVKALEINEAKYDLKKPVKSDLYKGQFVNWPAIKAVVAAPTTHITPYQLWDVIFCPTEDHPTKYEDRVDSSLAINPLHMSIEDTKNLPRLRNRYTPTYIGQIIVSLENPNIKELNDIKKAMVTGLRRAGFADYYGPIISEPGHDGTKESEAEASKAAESHDSKKGEFSKGLESSTDASDSPDKPESPKGKGLELSAVEDCKQCCSTRMLENSIRYMKSVVDHALMNPDEDYRLLVQALGKHMEETMKRVKDN